MLWVQVRRGLLTADEARGALAVLRDVVEPTPTAALNLHEVALEMGLAASHSTYDTLYLAFASAMGASAVIAADRPFVQRVRARPELAGMIIALDEWARSAGVPG